MFTYMRTILLNLAGSWSPQFTFRIVSGPLWPILHPLEHLQLKTSITPVLKKLGTHSKCSFATRSGFTAYSPEIICVAWKLCRPRSIHTPLTCQWFSGTYLKSSQLWIAGGRVIAKVEEKREIFSLRKLRKPGEREREKHFAPFFEISHTKSEKTFL
jgi:hypothetical protein